MKRICVFCGSGLGINKDYAQAANNLGEVLVKNKIGLVFGGGQVGLMGKVARAVHDLKGEVIGIIPQALYDKEVAFKVLPDLRIVDSMHKRKALMEELSDGFIALPGGLGTIEEFFEVLTWGQLGMHHKPCGILNVAHFFDPLIRFLEHVVEQGFIEPDHRKMILMAEDPDALLRKFESYTPPRADKARWALKMMKG